MRPQLRVALADGHSTELCLNGEHSHTHPYEAVPIAKPEYSVGRAALAYAVP